MHHHHARVTKHEQKMAHPDQVVKDPTRHSDGKLNYPSAAEQLEVRRHMPRLHPPVEGSGIVNL